ncbi:MAG: hypothetical protein QXY36_00045 [Sulfolobales archaeon]
MLEIYVRDGKFVVLEGLDEVRELNLGNYVKSLNAIVLDISEVAYLIYKKLGRLLVDGKELTLDELFTKYSRSPNDWIKFVVLCDLRERGRKAKAGFSDNSLIFERDGRYLVYVTEENSPITPNELVSWLSSALSKEYEPLIAVVDAHGDVTYYELLSVRARDLKEVIV